MRITTLVASAVWLCPITYGQHSANAQREFFENQVRPILAGNCFGCHSTAALGGLRLDSRDAVLKGGKTGPAVVSGDPEGSLMIQAVRRTHERFKMPPAGKIKEEQIAALIAWIKTGVYWPDETGKPAAPPGPGEYVITPEQRAFWAFQRVKKPALPNIVDAHWPKTGVDYFIRAAQEKAGVKPVEPASKRILIRRATFDLIGLPPTPEQVDAFEKDSSLDAFAKVVERLLASPHYGERWGRYWLDLARYSDGKIGPTKDDPYPNAYRYRDWVIRAFNEDMPYDLFAKAQLAADLLPREDRERLLPGLGFHALAPTEVAGVPADDRVDVTGKVFLGLTVGCAQCHDHKYDPIPTKDYYSTLGIFKSSDIVEIPLTASAEVERYRNAKKQVDEQQAAINEFVEKQSDQLIDILMTRTARYVLASWNVLQRQSDVNAVAAADKLDRETLQRWVRYLSEPRKEHPFLRPWVELVNRRAPLDDVNAFASQFQARVLAIHAEKKEIEDRNYVKLGGAKGAKNSKTRQFANLEFLAADKGYLWRDLASGPFTNVGDDFHFDGGIYYYGRGVDTSEAIDRFIQGDWKEHLNMMRARLADLKRQLPPKYSFLHGVRDAAQPANIRVAIRGEMANLGEEAPRRFFRILCDGEPRPYTKGSGRLELADDIANAANPLFARVMANRIWQHHFGYGIVRTPENFGRLGELPTNPELLDYLAARLVENHWSIKSLHREIMLSAVYALSATATEPGTRADSGNRLHWRADLIQRLDAEAIRDSILAVAGTLDSTSGGPPQALDDSDNRRRTVYGVVARTKMDGTLSLFDFPDPNITSEQRLITVGPLQRLFFMNSPFVLRQSEAFASRLQREALGDVARIQRAYRLLYSRPAKEAEVGLGLDYLKDTNNSWKRYAQALLSSSEFLSVN